MHKKKAQPFRPNLNRVPLHLPKQQPKFKKNTLIHLLEKENRGLQESGTKRAPSKKFRDPKISPTRKFIDTRKRASVGGGELLDLDLNKRSKPITKKQSEPLNPTSQLPVSLTIAEAIPDAMPEDPQQP